MTTRRKSRHLPFRPRARLLVLLGDQLIRDSGVAVFELVKNAYDADATECTVRMHDIASHKSSSIVIEDNGEGMTWETVTGVWLEPGTDHKAKQRASGQRTRKFKRLPLGEKGVGRFAVHKLGKQITLVSRAAHNDEVVVTINWVDFEKSKYLEDVPVAIESRPPEVFRGKATGTRIVITELRDTKWTRGKIRNLHRAITAICSPFSEPDDFSATLVLESSPDWLDGLTDVNQILTLALFRVRGSISGNGLSYSYEFRPSEDMKGRIEGRKVAHEQQDLWSVVRKGEPLDLTEWAIGNIGFDFSVYDREPMVLSLTTSDKAGLKGFLDQNGGIRVYRDGVRVYDFGEPGNDWLDLGSRRVNIPTVRISNNQVLGAVSLEADASQDLIEKTNREGFIENDAYHAFRDAVLYAVTQIEAERKIDKQRLREQYSRKRNKEPVLQDLSELREEIEKRNLVNELGAYVNRIETQFVEVRERLMTAAGAGLTLTTVIHEVEKIIKEISAAIRGRATRDQVKGLVEHLAEMVDGLGFLVRKSGKGKEHASTLLEQTFFNVEYRLKAHKITAVNGMTEGDPDFVVSCVRRLVISTLMNLVDNSIYWTHNRRIRKKMLYVGTTFELANKPCIVVADNGPGFVDPPEYLVEPFFTRKTDGMGLGLHFANEVAKIHQGRLVFPEPGDVTLPKEFTGAVVALEFSGEA